MKEFPTGKHFSAWLALSPNQRITGGKVKSSHTLKRKNRISRALRDAANVIGNHRGTPLNDFFQRIAFKKGRAHAITATARKLAVIIYNMLTKKESYKPIENKQYKERLKQQSISRIRKQMKKHGIQMMDFEFI